ncbi:hypothetical protein [Janibacter melonis]|uniref:hypothetical protein n=1 Tax=Janibacter melonis TaxID=262209 RepID=UPI002095AB32|nr:hypothetical protein [Janibacter melonis]
MLEAVGCDDELLLFSLFPDEEDREDWHVLGGTNSPEPDQRPLLSAGGAQSAVLRVVWIITAPLVPNETVSAEVVVIWAGLALSAPNGANRQCRVQHCGLSNASLSVHEGECLASKAKLRDLVVSQ